MSEWRQVRPQLGGQGRGLRGSLSEEGGPAPGESGEVFQAKGTASTKAP